MGHQNANDLAVGGRHWLGRGQLRRRQRVVNGHDPRLQVAAPACLEQRPPHRCAGELTALLGRRGQLQHRKGLRLGQLGTKGGQRAGVELPQRAA
jgi:hypothetical protein